MKINKPLVGILIFVLICAGWFFYDKPLTTLKQETTVLPAVNNAFLSEDAQGKRVWELNIDTMTVDPVKQVNTFKGVKGKLYRENGDIIQVTAQGGEINLITKDIKLQGDVVVTSSTKENLTTEELLLDNRNNQIIATGKAVLSRPDALAKADKIVTDKQFAKAKLIGNAYVAKQ